MLHYRRGTASFRYRNRAEITALTVNGSLIRYGLRAGARAIRLQCATVCHSVPETPLWYCGFWCLSISVVLLYLDRALPCCVHPNCSVFLSFPHTSVSSFVFRVVEEIFFVGERVIFDP